MTKLILVRHGESQANGKGLFAGHTDYDLTETGFKQAKLTALALTQKFNIDKIYSSDLKRAYNTGLETANILGLTIKKSEKLREIYAGKWENVLFNDLQVLFKEDYDKWLFDIGNACCTEGETVKELGERIYSEVLDIAKENDGKTVLITTHATPIRVLMCLVQNLPLSQMATIPWVTNASYTVLEYDDNGFKLVVAGESSHLEDLNTPMPKNV